MKFLYLYLALFTIANALGEEVNIGDMKSNAYSSVLKEIKKLEKNYKKYLVTLEESNMLTETLVKARATNVNVLKEILDEKKRHLKIIVLKDEIHENEN